MGGYDISQGGLGKNHQGIINPVQAVNTTQMGASERAGGARHGRKKAPVIPRESKEDEIDLDIHNTEKKEKHTGAPWER